ncbi:MAG: bifunctional 4-hydroxy-2-oxoglutarate aldolase/2-dehydro-3-deoxy-phosphogluconate aldolase [Trueperaceae bacterium]
MSPAHVRRTPQQALALLLDAPVIPVHADDDAERLVRIVTACVAGGVRAFEATDRLPGSFDAFVHLRTHIDRRLPELMLGVGSVDTVDDATAYVRAGAEFVVTPFVDPDLAAWCRDAGVLYVPGTLTPSEIRTARRGGSPLVKLFPAGTVGPTHLKHLRGPDRTTRFLPTGGLDADPDTLRAWAEAGASCVGLGGGLLGAGADDDVAAGALRDRCAAALRTVLASRPDEVARPA